MNVILSELAGVVIIDPQVHADPRGFFLESYHAERYTRAGLPARFVQDNHSRSAPGTIRGLHYQLRRPQGKLVRVVRGRVLDVAVDIRRNSPMFGRSVAVELSADNKRQLFIPAGFAHGFCVLGQEEAGELEYKCTDYYAPDDQHGIAWNDRTIAIPWPIAQPILSAQDRAFAPLSAERDDLPTYAPTAR